MAPLCSAYDRELAIGLDRSCLFLPVIRSPVCDPVRVPAPLEKCFCIGVDWVVYDLACRTDFYHFALTHNGYTIRDVINHREVMAHEHVSEAEFILQVFKEVQDLRLNGHVERGGWFITDQELRVQGQCSGDANALSLTTGEGMRVAAQVSGRQADQIYQFPNAGCLTEAIAHAVDDQRLLQDFVEGASWVEGRERILKDDLRAFAVLEEFFLIKPLNVTRTLFRCVGDFAACEWKRTQHSQRCSCFSGAGLSHDAKAFTSAYGQRDVVERGGHASAFFAAQVLEREGFADAFQFDQRGSPESMRFADRMWVQI